MGGLVPARVAEAVAWTVFGVSGRGICKTWLKVRALGTESLPLGALRYFHCFSRFTLVTEPVSPSFWKGMWSVLKDQSTLLKSSDKVKSLEFFALVQTELEKFPRALIAIGSFVKGHLLQYVRGKIRD